MTIADPAGALYGTVVGHFVMSIFSRSPLGLRDLGVRRQLRATHLERGLERLLGVLLEVEVDRQLDVEAVDRWHFLEQSHRSVGGVDLVDALAPRAVQHRLHAQLDAELADPLVQQVVGFAN